MINKINNQKMLIIVIIAFLVILIVSFNFIKKEKSEEFVIESAEEAVEEVIKEKTIVVHITGAVKFQGIIEVKEGARISDVIKNAGGVTDDADVSKVNLAYIVKDAQKIYIPSIYDESNIEYISNKSGDNVIINENEKGENDMVNINSATQTELEQLPGIGPSTALKIIDYREKNGKFKNIDGIKDVPGIGESKFNNIKNNIEV